ncbi:MAG: NifB/NifX family molybdenum-iron cluster-binding protein [Candidatus Saccharicenans sp.]
MRIAISTDNGYVSAHFGRCSSYTIVEIEGDKVVKQEEISNPGHSPGFLPRFLAEKGVNLLITGGIGQRAKDFFNQFKIEVISGVQGPVDEVIGQFRRHELQPGEELCEHEHDAQSHHQEHHPHSEEPETSPASSTFHLSADKLSAGGLICFTSKGPDLDSELEEAFGRAPYFIFIDPKTLKFEAYNNEAVNLAHGAGIQSGQLMAEKGVTVLFTGQVGPNARRVLEAAGIQIIELGQEKRKIREIINSLKSS